MKNSLTAYTLIGCISSLILVGCSSNNNRAHTPAPVIVPGQQVNKATAVVIPKAVITPAPVTETKVEPTPIAAKPESTTTTLSPEAVLAEQHQVSQQQQALHKVVIILPDHPSLGDVNRDIEKGIRAAHQAHPINSNLQLIFIHDQLPPEQLLAKAKEFSPDWIIGPLTKTDIQGMMTQLGAQHIVLNRLDSATAALQFGLPAEDEATQLLNSLDHNTQPIAVVASNDAFEQRMLNSLQQQANEQQIPVLPISVDSKNATINTWLENEGGIAQSRQRIDRLSKLLHSKLDITPKSRSDLQALILLGNMRQAHSVMPAVQFHQISWPVFATSRLLPTHKGDTFNEPDCNNVRVLTPPYLLSETGPETPFEALGWDSYLLLGNPNAINIHGMTGKLLRNNSNQIIRQLSWQKIHQNQLVPLK
jgi:hypothetical protein